ncbi:hypothetical protein D3C86_1486160 [compost metagenome]
MGRGEREGRHHHGRDAGSRQHQTVGAQALAQLGQDHRAKNGAHAHRAQQDAIEAGATAQHPARHQRQQRPYRAGENEEHRRAQQHDVQVVAGPGIADSGAEGAEELL